MRFEARRVGLVVVLGAAVVLPWAKVASELHSPPAPPATGRAEGVVWANRVFVNRTALGVWLRSRGASYDEWARNHPTYAGTTAGEATAKARNAPNRPVKPGSAASAQTPDRNARSAPAVGGSSSWIGRLAWLALALVLTAGLGVAVFRSLERVSDEEDEDDDASRLAGGELREPGGGGPAQPMRVRSSASWR